MKRGRIGEAIVWAEKGNADLYAHLEKLARSVDRLARKLDDAKPPRR